MQFHMNGRFLAAIDRENDAWTVSTEATGEPPSAYEVSLFADLERNDIGLYLDALLQEYADAGPGPLPGQA
jgi:hypothetical protein